MSGVGRECVDCGRPHPEAVCPPLAIQRWAAAVSAALLRLTVAPPVPLSPQGEEKL